MAIVFKTPKSALNTTTKTIQNLGNGDCPPCPEVNLEAAELEYTQNGEYTVTPEQGVDGFSSIDVTVNIPSDVNNQNKTVDPSTSSQSVSADSGYSGLGTVTVNAVTSSIDNNISAGNIKKDVTILGVTGNYDPQPTLSNLNITPSTNSQEYNPAISGVDGYSLVRVNAVTAAIDPNIQAENILEGVTILGVSGTDPGYDIGYGEGESAGYENGYTEGEAAGEIAGAAAQKALLTSTTITQNGTSTREDGWNSVTVNVIPDLQAKTVNPSTSQQTVTPDQGKDGLSSVTVNAVTNAIDANISAGNIKNGVTILGVTGNVLEANFDPNTQFTGDVTGTYLITPQSGYNGFDEFEVTVESNPIGSFWNPFEVSDNTTMADVYNKLDEGGYFDGVYALFGMGVESGSIDSETGYYIAEDGNGNSFAIEPFFDNPDYDPELSPEDQPDVPALIFPENFDLSGLNIQVEADFENVTITENEPEDPNLVPTYTTEIALCVLSGINWNSDMESWPLYWNGGLSGGIETSTRNLRLSTNEPQVMSISSSEPWEIELDQPQAQSQMNVRPLTKSGLRSAAPTLEIDQMSGDAGVFTLNVLSTSDQATGFTVRGLNSGNEVYVEVNSVGNYFTVESLEDDNTVNWSSYDDQHLFEYSTDEGETWTTMTLTQSGNRYVWSLTINTGDTIKFRGNNSAFYKTVGGVASSCHLNATDRIDIYGNICSLLTKDDYANYILTEPYAFADLFDVYNLGGKIVDASGLILPNNVTRGCYYYTFAHNAILEAVPELPAITLSESCYRAMFSMCVGLEVAPELPAVVLANNCYNSMFEGCRSLTEAPALTALYADYDYCYYGMFKGCTALETAPVISAISVGNASCQYMFQNCTSLIAAPELPATSIQTNCYHSMFQYCSALEDAPTILPATTLYTNCYVSMFDGCTSLTSVPELPSTTLAQYCYQGMFSNCSTLTKSPILPAATLVRSCYQNMFSGCSSLTSVTCLATSISANSCVSGWLNNVAASGTFYKDQNMSSWTVGTNVPSGWTVEDYVEPSE